MNSDKQLAEYLGTCLRAVKLRALSETISADFVFSSPRIKAYNFDQYCQHVESWSVSIEIEIINIEQKGDVFIIDQIIQAVDIPRNYFATTKRRALITSTNHIVQSIQVEFSDPNEIAYMNMVNPIPEDFKP